MPLHDLNASEAIQNNDKALKSFNQLQRLISYLKNRPIPEPIHATINGYLDEINTSQLAGKDLEKLLATSLSKIQKLLEKELKLIPKHHYRNQWMVLGMSAFGLPIGVVFGMSIDNMGLLGVGLPIGMAIGIAVGSGMDEKARKEGRQLPYETQA